MARRGMFALLLTLLILGAAGVSWAAIAVSITDVFGLKSVYAQLMADQEATTDGEWVEVLGIQPFSISIEGITDATVEIDGSNAPVKPANNTHGFKLNAVNITTNQIIQVDMTIAWVKVRVPTYVSGTINAYLRGVVRAN